MAPVPLLFCALLLLGALAGSADAACTKIIGGGSSGAQLAPALLTACGAACGNPTYDLTNALGAINNFNSGEYCVGFADNPMNAVEENTGVAKKRGKLTLPIVISTYGFFTNLNNGNVRMDWKATYNVYSNVKGARVWSKYVSGGAGAIVPLARASGAGVNSLIKQFWKYGSNGQVVVTPFDETQFPAAWKISQYLTSTGSICNAVKSTTGAIGYAQVNICANDGIQEIALKNAAGQYIKGSSTDAVTSQSIPRTVSSLSRSASWSSIQTVFQIGQKTPPIVSMEYLFIQATDLILDNGQNGKFAKAIASYFNTNGGLPQFGPKYGLDALPPDVLSANKAAIAGVKT